MSITLGLNFNHADSSACLFVDNNLKFAIEEERINRIKHWAGLPFQSIHHCLNESSLNFNDVTDITVNTNPRSNLNQKIIFFLKNYLFGKKKSEIYDRVKNKYFLKKDLNSFFQRNDKNL